MDVVAWSQNLTQERCADTGIGYVSQEELFATSDMVSIHLVLSDRTRNLVTALDLQRMKPSSYLINTSRGPIVNESALIRALREGWIAGAGLDVFEVEPLPETHPLRSLDNVVLTPHIGYVTTNNYRVFFGEIVANIAAFLDGNLQG
jgi:D-3-phosphoglycerate dehydrogenase